LRHAWEAMARQIAQLLHRHRVGRVVIGWPKGILHATRGTRRQHQMTHAFWRFAQLIECLTRALERGGIAVERVGERGTSCACCRCGSVQVRRMPRHVVACRDCHLIIHSDQAGSRNMVRQRTPAMDWDGGETPLWPATQRWSGQQWVAVKHPLTATVRDRAA
jgi:transposase